MKRAFVVMGMVSSGTRLMARILTAAGCEGDGNKDHTQRYDTDEPTGDLIVIRRHRPNPKRRPPWATSPNLFISLERLGYTCHAVIMHRNWYCTTASALTAPHVDSEEESYDMAMDIWRQMIIDMPRHVPFTVVSYDNLVTRPDETIAWLFDHLGLKQVYEIEAIADGNEKYYQ